jgi:NodT family efflux transporter outer membrane factor (OMF) lipoprotein
VKKFLCLLPALLLAGCSAYHSKLQPQPATLPDRFHQLPDSAAASLATTRFWEEFHDPGLNDLVSEALEGNLGLAQSLARIDQAEAQTRISQASELPYLNLLGAAGRDRQLLNSQEVSGSSLRLSAAAGYEIDLWGKLASRRQAAELSASASRADLAALRLSIAAQVSDFYYLLAEQQAQLDLTDQIIGAQQGTLDRLDSRYAEGLAPPLDLYQARQNILAARAQRPVYEEGAARARHALAVLLGRYPEAETVSVPATLPDLIPAVPVGLPSTLLTRRPDLVAALDRLRGTDAQVAAAVAERFPAFNLSAGLGLIRSDYLTSVSGLVWNLLLEAVQPVFDHGRRQAEVARQKALVRESLAGYHQAILKAIQEVEDGLAANAAQERRLTLLAARATAVASTLRLAEDQYFEGLTDYLSVLTAQKNNFEVQSQLLSGRRQLISTRIGLWRALGGDWGGLDKPSPLSNKS